jgi:hypothetical protein
MRFVFVSIAIILFTFSSLSCYSQVGKAKENARSYKSGSSSNSSSGRSSGSGGGSSWDSSGSSFGEDFLISIMGEIIILPFKALYLGQADQLFLANVDDWRVSFEGRMLGGYGPLENVALVQPQIRGNWGLFSTQLRYNRIFDNTGVLSTWDWQIIQFNFINHEVIRWVFGLGLSHEIEFDDTYFEGSSSFTVFLADRVWAPTVEYRWTGDTTPRQEFSAILDYRPRNQNNVFNTFHAGFLHQNWYGEKFNMLVAGVGFKIQ